MTTKSNPSNNFPAVLSYFAMAWKIYRKRLPVLLPLVLIPVGLDYILLSTVFKDVRDFGGEEELASVSELLETFPVDFWPYIGVSLILGSIMAGALITALITFVRDNKKFSVLDSINAGLELFLEVFIISVLVGLIVIAGLFLFFVPGIIAGFFLMFSIHARLDKKLPIIESLKFSYRVVISNWIKCLQLLLFIFSLIVGLDIASRSVAESISDDAIYLVYAIFSVPMSAYVSTVFTVGYFEMKKAI